MKEWFIALAKNRSYQQPPALFLRSWFWRQSQPQQTLHLLLPLLGLLVEAAPIVEAASPTSSSMSPEVICSVYTCSHCGAYNAPQRWVCHSWSCSWHLHKCVSLFWLIHSPNTHLVQGNRPSSKPLVSLIDTCSPSDHWSWQLHSGPECKGMGRLLHIPKACKQFDLPIEFLVLHALFVLD